MANKNSNRLECRQCGMINWATDEYCRRCQQSLGGGSAGSTSNRFNLYLSIFIAGLVVPIVVGMMNPGIGFGLTAFFMLAALIIILFCNVALLVEMFRVSIVWGLAGIFLAPLSTLLFIAMYWDLAKSRILISLAATAYCFIIFLGMNQIIGPNVAKNTTSPPPAPVTKSADQMPASKSSFPSPAKNEPKKKVPGK